MLLAIDVGNTNTVLALFDGDSIHHQWRLATDERRTGDEYRALILPLLKDAGVKPKKIKDVIVSSVVPQTDRPLTRFVEELFGKKPTFVTSDLKALNISVNIDNPGQVGADRLVNAIGAYERFGGNLIIVDFGTATTFDVIGKDGSYEGGVIAPGINLSLKALYEAAAKLPLIAVEPPEGGRATGKTTEEAMRSGIFWGYIGLIEGIIARLKAEHDIKQVIATGGLAPIFSERTPAIHDVAQDLTLQGLYLIHKHQGKN